MGQEMPATVPGDPGPTGPAPGPSASWVLGLKLLEEVAASAPGLRGPASTPSLGSWPPRPSLQAAGPSRSPPRTDAGSHGLPVSPGRTLPSWGRALRSQDFALLCRDGSRADVTEWRRCHLARVPAHAVVVRADTDGGLVFRLLNEGQVGQAARGLSHSRGTGRLSDEGKPRGRRKGVARALVPRGRRRGRWRGPGRGGRPQQPPAPQRLFSQEGSSFQMFSSEAYGQKNLLFKDSTSELVPIATQTYEAWLGREYLHAVKGLLCDPNRKSACVGSQRHSPAPLGRPLAKDTHPRSGAPWPPREPVASTSCFWGSGEEAAPELHGLLYPRCPICSKGWDPDHPGPSRGEALALHAELGRSQHVLRSVPHSSSSHPAAKALAQGLTIAVV